MNLIWSIATKRTSWNITYRWNKKRKPSIEWFISIRFLLNFKLDDKPYIKRAHTNTHTHTIKCQWSQWTYAIPFFRHVYSYSILLSFRISYWYAIWSSDSPPKKPIQNKEEWRREEKKKKTKVVHIYCIHLFYSSNPYLDGRTIHNLFATYFYVSARNTKKPMNSYDSPDKRVVFYVSFALVYYSDVILMVFLIHQYYNGRG